MLLPPVYWIGGAPGAGKSTVARRLAARYGLRLYDTDAEMAGHARRTTAADAPHLHDFMAMSMDDRWVNRSPETMLDTFHWFRGEAFDLIVDDLRQRTGPVVAEGFRLLPHLVAPLLPDPNHAVWLLPTPEFRHRALQRPDGELAIATRTSDPERAITNLRLRDALFTARLAAETERLHLPTLHLDGTLAEEATERLIAERFGLAR